MLACCPVNITEVHMGMRPQEAQRTEDFLASLEFYPAYREIDAYVYDRVRYFLRRRHQCNGSRGTRRFSSQVVNGKLGVMRLQRG